MLFLTSFSFAQNYMYVNADAAYLRQLPVDTSRALIILHAPTKIEVQEITDRDHQLPEIKENWVIGRLMVSSGSQFSGEAYSGYILKRDLVPSLSEVTVPGTDTTETLLYTKITPGDNLVAPQINYQNSSRGGCYFVNSSGKREYVGVEKCLPRQAPPQQSCPIDQPKREDEEEETE